MRPPRVRFGIRRLMALVAIAGLVLGAGVALRRRQQRFERTLAAHSDGWTRYARGGSAYLHEDATCAEFREKEYPPSEGGNHPHPIGGLASKHDRRWQGYHAEMATKYLLAARRPWLPVGADPPAPPGPDRPDDRGPMPARPAPGPGTGP